MRRNVNPDDIRAQYGDALGIPEWDISSSIELHEIECMARRYGVELHKPLPQRSIREANP